MEINKSINFSETKLLIPLTEKYRPRTVNQIIGQDNLIFNFNEIVKSKQCPNLILVGPPGVGKTTAAHALAREILGVNYKQYVLELNASDERKLDDIKYYVENFSRQLKTDDTPHKIIIMDEADNITIDSQHIIRVVMDENSTITRFIFTCNILGKIIEPIQSRCTSYFFSPIKPIFIEEFLKKVCQAENILFEPDGLKEITKISPNDMRSCLNLLQAVHLAFNSVNLYNVLSTPSDSTIIYKASLKCINAIINNQINEISIISDLIEEGYLQKDILSGLINLSINSDEIPENLKLLIFENLSLTYINIIKGIDSPIQLIASLYSIYNDFYNYPNINF